MTEELFDPNEEDFQDFYEKLLEVCKEFYLKQGYTDWKILTGLSLAYNVLKNFMEI